MSLSLLSLSMPVASLTCCDVFTVIHSHQHGVIVRSCGFHCDK